MESIGDRIKKARGGEARDTLAAKIGFSRNTIVNYETGKSDPVSNFLVKILEERPDINPSWLLTGDGEMAKSDEKPGVVDHSLLEAVIAAVEEHLAAIKGKLLPAKKAQLIITLYDLFANKEDKKVDKAVVISLFKLAA